MKKKKKVIQSDIKLIKKKKKKDHWPKALDHSTNLAAHHHLPREAATAWVSLPTGDQLSNWQENKVPWSPRITVPSPTGFPPVLTTGHLLYLPNFSGFSCSLHTPLPGADGSPPHPSHSQPVSPAIYSLSLSFFCKRPLSRPTACSSHPWLPLNFQE